MAHVGNRLAQACAAFLAAALAFLLAFPVAAEPGRPLRGVALVIGNGDYAHLPKLANPAGDARAVEQLLDRLGFRTELRPNRTARQLRRDLDAFAEDAVDADAAVLYYSGHGIEAGGENFLVPVDADLSSLDAAAERLVPVQALIEELKARIPVLIVLLDACRDNPFPPGASLRMAAGGAPEPVAAAGLGQSRGAVPLNAARSSPPASDESLAAVLGFAAEPGKAALDGAPGGNSPYAAALLRHLSAMSGAEFGAVLRMVTEEVYLKTGGRQRPWTAESRRRDLYFDIRRADPAGAEGEILAERRGLLLTIAGLSAPRRTEVETLARQSDVPMDAVYGMLKALGQETPRDPAELGRLLQDQTARLKQMMAERAVLAGADPRIAELARLADAATAEGALATARIFHDRAKARIEELKPAIDRARADIRDRQLEFASVYARSAETRALAFDYLGAADDFERAYVEVEPWDHTLAWRYLFEEARTLSSEANFRGGQDVMRRAIRAADAASRVALAADRPEEWASSRNVIGNLLIRMSWADGERGTIEAAIAEYQAALRVWSRERQPGDWAKTQSNMGNALVSLGERETGTARLRAAEAAYRAALEGFSREKEPVEWAITLNNLGYALWRIGERETGTAALEEAAAAYRAALEELPREKAPLDWARTHNNLGNVLTALGERGTGVALLEEAVSHFRLALEERPRNRMPTPWAETMNDLGGTLASLSARSRDIGPLREAASVYESALEERPRDGSPLEWAITQSNLCGVLRRLGELERNFDRVAAALGRCRSALLELTRERAPGLWVNTQNNLANALVTLGEQQSDAGRLREAVAVFRALAEATGDGKLPAMWTSTQLNLGGALVKLDAMEPAGPWLADAEASFRAALAASDRTAAPFDWAEAQLNLGMVLTSRGARAGSADVVGEGIVALRAAAEAWQGLDEQPAWASSVFEMSRAHFLRGQIARDGADLDQAGVAIRTLRDAHHTIGDSSQDGFFADRLAEIAAAKAKLK